MKELCTLANFAIAQAQELGVSSSIHLDDFIFHFVVNHPCFSSKEEAVHYYFHDGRKSALLLSDILNDLGPHFQTSCNLLEFASGYGCVTRHLPLVMPYINFTACDIHEEAIQFISKELGQKAIISQSDPKNFKPSSKYDVIFSLSFFSHMPRTTWGQWILAHYEQLNSKGALIFTTHGLVSKEKEHLDFIMPEDGFWFEPISEQMDLNTAEYGTAIVTKEFVEQEVLTQAGCSIHKYSPGFWWGHQDLYVVIKP
ncbi:MAG: class I SAM-dependent methyltransferase [Legionellales bacterium]|jgi:hypothetical protein